MCGISGKVNFFESYVDEKSLSESIDKLESRGPDNKGIWIDGGCGLAHRRLSILDLSNGGSQPMISSDNRYVCVFNGEIYNYKEIRHNLGEASISWKGKSDTEVLLEAWSRWGVKSLEYLDGMFAFSIWDKKNQKLYAARDRIGEKPFYYHWNGKSFSFSSRPSPLFSLEKNLSSEFDHQSLRYYLESGYIPAPFSIYKDVKKLEPSSYLEIDKNGIKKERYSTHLSIKPEKNWKFKNEKELLDELDELITDSVSKRMLSDVPLGAFLSGGIDSSLIVAIMAKISKEKIKTFTIGFEEKEYDESSHAKEVANYIGTDHDTKILSVNDLIDLIPYFTKNYDEPFFDSSAFPTLAVSKLAKQKVTVSLSGDGGDELFGGYHYYKIAQVLDPFFLLPNNIRNLISIPLNLMPSHKLKLFGQALKQKSLPRAFAFSRSIAKDFHNILSEEVLNQTKSIHDLFEIKSKEFPKGLHSSEQGMRLDTVFTLNDDYLQKTDLASMAYSLESRAPFLNKDLVEWALRLPIKWKLKGFNNKYILRKLLYRYVPQKIVDRPKKGFGVPINHWLRNELYEWSLERLENKELFKNLPLNQKAIINLFHLHKSGKRDVHPLLWSVLMLLEFNQRH